MVLTWEDPGNAGITGYEVRYEVSTSALPDTWDAIEGSDVNTTRHLVRGLTNGRLYTFEVRAKATATPGDSSVATDTPVPGAPAGLTGLSRDGSVVLSWEDPGDAAIDRYQVRHAESGAALPGWRERHYVAGSRAGTTDHQVTGLTNGTDYTFEVRVRAGAVHGAAAEVTAMALSCPALALSGRRVVDGLNDTTVTLGQALSMQAAVSGVQGNRYSLMVEPAQGSSLTIDEQSGAVTGTATAVGTYAVTVTATDDRACTWSHTFTVQVCPVITVAAIEDVSVTAGGNVSRTARATGGCGAITYAMTGAPEGVRIETVTENGQSVGQISGAPGGPAREYEVTVTATDAEENTGDERFTITVQCGEITLTAPGTVGVTVGSSKTATAMAAGGQPGYTYAKTSGPSWVTVTEGGNVNVREAPAPQRTYPVGVSIEDVHGCTGTGSFTVAVCTQMVFEAINAVTVTAGSSVSRRAVANGGCGEKTYERSDGPGWVTVENDGSITVAPPTGTATGTYTAKVRATSDYGITAEKSFRIVVPRRCEITVDAGSDVTVTVGQNISRTVTATGGGASRTYSLSIHPSSGLSLGIQKDARGRGSITGSASTPGTYTVTVTADADDCRSDSDPFVVTVRPRPCSPITVSINPSPVKVVAGQSATATASAQGGCGTKRFRKKVNSGTPTWVTVAEDGGITVSPPAGTAARNYTATVTATDTRNNAKDASFTITVCDPVVINPITNRQVVVGEEIRITPGARGGCGSIAYSKTGTLPPGVTFASETGVISGRPSAAGEYTATVTATDDVLSTNFASTTFTITVVNPPPPLGIMCPSNTIVTVGDSIKSTASAWEGVAPYTFSRPSVTPSGLTLGISTAGQDGEKGTVTGEAARVGVYRVTVTVRDSDGALESCRFNVTVTPRICDPITVSQNPDPVQVAAGGRATVTVSAEGGCGTKTFGNPGRLGWVRKTGSNQYTVEPPSGTAPGPYTFGVTATDAEGNTGPGTINVTVACPDIVVTQSPDPVTVAAGGTETVTVSAEGGCGTKTFGNPGGLGWVRKTGSNQYTVEPPSGTAPGPYTFGVTATDAEGNTGSGTINVTVACPTITIAEIENVDVEVRQNMPSMTASASGGRAPYTFTKEFGPSWVTVSTGGAISGRAPNTTGTYLVTVKATDAGRCWGTTTFEIKVINPPVKIRDIDDVEATVGQAMPARAASASGGETPYVFTMSGKPSWVSFNASSGRISGTPSSTGTSTATVTVTDKKGVTDTTPSFQLRVSSPLTIAAISDAVVTWYLDMDPIQVSVSGGRGSYTYDLESEPAGISISSSGSIGGTPTQLGSATVTVVVDDQDDRRVTTSFRMTVALPGDFNGDGRRDATDAKLFNK